jgi:hypothetical protein
LFEPGERSHAEEKRHIHFDHCEVFLNLQGKGMLEIEGKNYAFNFGDVFLIERRESHHLTADEEDPVFVLWITGKILFWLLVKFTSLFWIAAIIAAISYKRITAPSFPKKQSNQLIWCLAKSVKQ